MSVTDQEARNRDLVRQVYESSFAGDIDAFVGAMHEDFEEYVPPDLPWGGVHRGPDAFRDNVVPLLAAAVDFSTMRLVSLSADGEHVAALLNARSMRGDDLWIAEHWTLRDGKAWRLRVFYHDTRPLLEAATA